MSNPTENKTTDTAILPVINVVPDINQFLKDGASQMEATFTLVPQNFDSQAVIPVQQNFVFLGDVSGSMDQPASKLSFMKKSLVAAIRKLPETAMFAVVTFSDDARAIVPLCLATEDNKNKAIEKVERIRTEGGTYMSKGLREALKEHLKNPQAAGNCIMLTDGQNDSGDGKNLENILVEYQERARSGQVLQVHTRGVGDDFSFNQVNLIATATKGKPPAYIATPQELIADFESLIEEAKGNAVTDVRLHVWTPKIHTVKACRKTMPSLQDLLGSEETDTTSGILKSFPLGAMNAEQSEYFVVFGVQPKPIGQEGSAGKVWVTFKLNGQLVESERFIVRAQWTDEKDTRSMRVPKGVARAKGNVEFEEVVNEAITALVAGKEDVATQKLGRAAQIAHEKGDTELTERISALAEVQDGEKGTVRLRKDAAKNKDATLKLSAASIRTQRKSPASKA